MWQPHGGPLDDAAAAAAAQAAAQLQAAQQAAAALQAASAPPHATPSAAEAAAAAAAAQGAAARAAQLHALMAANDAVRADPASLAELRQLQAQAAQAGATIRHLPPSAPAAGARSAEAAPALPRPAARRVPPPGAPPPPPPPLALPESAIFRDLLAAERRLDAALASRKATLRDTLRAPVRLPARLRVWARVDHEGTEGADSADPPRWTLTLWGRLVGVAEAEGIVGEKPAGEDSAAAQPPGGKGARPFLAHVRRLAVATHPLDPSTAPPPSSADPPATVTWARATADARDLRDKVVVRRRWTGPTRVVVAVDADGAPDRAQPDAALAAITGAAPDTRARLLRAVWAHIARHGLAGRAEGGAVACDAALSAVVGGPSATASAVAAAVAARSPALPPPSFELVVDRGQAGPHVVTHDFDVELPLAAGDGAAAALLDRASSSPALEAAEQTLASSLRRLREHARRRAFLLGFSSSPAEFIAALAAAQARELRAARAAGAAGTAAYRGADVFKGAWVDDVVGRLLARKVAGGGD